MGLVWTIIIGFAAGAIAKFFMPGKEPGGFVLTTLLGIGGAFVGGWIFGLLGIYTASTAGHLISATAGAVVILFTYRKLKS